MNPPDDIAPVFAQLFGLVFPSGQDDAPIQVNVALPLPDKASNAVNIRLLRHSASIPESASQ